MGIRVGTAPITWGVCEIPGWGDELPPARVLAEMAALGFTGTELGPWGYLPDSPEELRAELARHGLSLIGGFCPITVHRADGYQAGIQFGVEVAKRLRDLGGRVLVVADAGDDVRRAVAGHFDRSTALAFSPEEWVRFCDGVMELAERAVMMGLITAFHPHAGTYVETAEEITEVLERTSADLVGLCVDTGHLLFGGVDPLVLMVRYSARVRHVHLKDVSQSVLEAVRLEKPSYLEAVSRGIFVPLGEGMVDTGSLLSVLQAAGYEGWVVLEQDVRLKLPRDQDLPRRNAQRSRQVLLRFGV